MSKVAAYLQEHIQGRVLTNAAALRAASTDGSILTIAPEMVIYPKVTNDIRKVARFAWQLAEKGHVLSLTARGYGMDQTGGAIGTGAIIVLPAYMNRIFELDSKQKLVRIQPGVDVKALNDALALQGVAVSSLLSLATTSTIGGVVANNTRGPLSGRYGDMNDWVYQLEVVLASGDILQTGRLSKRELKKKKGLQTFEGEIYRTIDTLIDENHQLIDEQLSGDAPDNVGYSGIAKVKRSDGSFDLTPLFVGSQGTLGIVSEMIMKVEFTCEHRSAAVITFPNSETARDVVDKLIDFDPTFLEYFDSTLFTIAAAQGKTYDFYKDAEKPAKAVVLVGFDDFNERANHRKLKKINKMLAKVDAQITTADNEEAEALVSVRDVVSYLLVPSEKDLYAPPLFDGVYVPRERFEEFTKATSVLASKYDVVLPVYSRELEGMVFTRPLLHLSRVGDKQKIFKLLEEFSQMVSQYGGHFVAQDSEGRLKARFAYAALDDKVLALFAAIKAAFDPYDLLNPGVKQPVELRQLASRLRSDLDDAKGVSRLSAY